MRKVSDPPRLPRFSLKQLLMGVTCVALFLSLLYEPWTFHLRFALSRGALNELVERAAAGENIAPQQAGLFLVEKVDRNLRGGKVFTVLWTDSEAGFVHPGSDDFPHNDWSVGLRHDPDWSYFIQD